MRATWEDVKSAFQHHLEHYLNQGGEPALIGRRAEGSVSLQYAGRVVLELFQNALDRAEAADDQVGVLVRLVGNTLIVANNGLAFQVDPNFDYKNPHEGEERSDFNALCALHTSNKKAERQFGNKGIGFRAVFGVSDRVRVWSRLDKGGWWGIELRKEFRPVDWNCTLLGNLDLRIREAGGKPRPSFHLPIPLRSEQEPVGGLSGMETVVILQVDDLQGIEQIKNEMSADPFRQRE